MNLTHLATASNLNYSWLNPATFLLQLLNRLHIMSNIIYGCGAVLPFWDTEADEFEPKRLVESVTNLKPLKYVTSPRPVTLTLRGKNVRQEIAKVTFQLQVRFFPFPVFPVSGFSVFPVATGRRPCYVGSSHLTIEVK